MTKDRVSAHVASRVRCEAGIKCPYLIQRNKKASLQSRKRADTNFLFANENQMKRHRLHPGNCPGHSPFPELGVALVKPTTNYFGFLKLFATTGFVVLLSPSTIFFWDVFLRF
jgi:hypothetical protein